MLPIGLLVLTSASYLRESRRGGFGMSVKDDIFGQLAAAIEESKASQETDVTLLVVGIWNRFVSSHFDTKTVEGVRIGFVREMRIFQKNDRFNPVIITLPQEKQLDEELLARVFTLIYGELVGSFGTSAPIPIQRRILYLNTAHAQYDDVLNAVLPDAEYRRHKRASIVSSVFSKAETLVEHRNKHRSSVQRGVDAARGAVSSAGGRIASGAGALGGRIASSATAVRSGAVRGAGALGSRVASGAARARAMAADEGTRRAAAKGLAGAAAIGTAALGTRAVARKKLNRRRARSDLTLY